MDVLGYNCPGCGSLNTLVQVSLVFPHTHLLSALAQVSLLLLLWLSHTLSPALPLYLTFLYPFLKVSQSLANNVCLTSKGSI